MINALNKTVDTEDKEVDIEDNQLFGQTDSEILKTIKTNTEMTEMDILSTSFLFFFAGYETTSTLISHVFYSLAVNPEYQQRLYEEVMKFDGNYDYETIAKMHYLEACVAETLRLYTPLPSFNRVSTEEHTIGLLYIFFINIY